MSEETTVQSNPEEDKISFYCKGCKDFVEAEQINKRYAYKCQQCSSTDVAFGTKRSLQEYYIRRSKVKKAA